MFKEKSMKNRVCAPWNGIYKFVSGLGPCNNLILMVLFGFRSHVLASYAQFLWDVDAEGEEEEEKGEYMKAPLHHYLL